MNFSFYEYCREHVNNLISRINVDIEESDIYLKQYESQIQKRVECFKNHIKDFQTHEKCFLEFCTGYRRFGLNLTPTNDIVYREYAPGAKGISILGEFNNWNKDQYCCTVDQYGVWSITLPNVSGQPLIRHLTKFKVNVTFDDGTRADRNPMWSRYLIQDPFTGAFDSVFWNPPKKYKWTSDPVPKPTHIRIYEAHVGMSAIEPKIASYREFADNILPRIKNSGYTIVQLMAIMEHAYYGSFGYHVTNFFATSSRFGTPDDLKYLIDKAHHLGLYVIIDFIHSHASTNVLDGLNLFDGTDCLYFHQGARGYHQLWDSRLFNYQSWETLRFLLSNCSWYLDEFHIDGFRFDGVTSILYKHHGIDASIRNFDDYFGENFDLDGGVYLMLANFLIHTKNPDAITIAEDVSGMPTLCRPIEEGGFGFDFRLNMAIPDRWIYLLKEERDEYWNMESIVQNHINRRFNEKHIGYSESHDQAIVGDKTISMWLFNQEIYNNMTIDHQKTDVIDRGMALHKMIRLITFSLGGEGYLNFMGNEFGHPEWIDFPREGNNFSYEYCRRKWDLCDNKRLRYQFLHYFDLAMQQLDDTFEVLNTTQMYITMANNMDKVIVFEKGDLLFIFNFHPTESHWGYQVGTKWGTPHRIVLDTDEQRFDGYGRLNWGHHNTYPVHKMQWMNRPCFIEVFIPSRTAMVLIAEENLNKYNIIALDEKSKNINIC